MRTIKEIAEDVMKASQMMIEGTRMMEAVNERVVNYGHVQYQAGMSLLADINTELYEVKKEKHDDAMRNMPIVRLMTSGDDLPF